jgi:hypothetical protein
MPYQNRVTPFGELIVHPARGTLMGNRGCLVTPSGQLRSRHWQVRRWITCRLSFKNRRHPIWSSNLYTPLFFLDEATAFAAGHRPCAECRREDFNRFVAAWREVHAIRPDLRLCVDDIDRQLHQERVGLDGEKVLSTAPLDTLPPGSFVLLDDDPTPYLVERNLLCAWSPAGYTHARPRPPEATVRVLTPRSLVAVFRAGYAPGVYPATLSAAGDT